MPFRSPLAALGLLLLAVGAAPAQQPQAPLPTAVLKIGPATLTAEIARTPEQLEKGLMFRRDLPDNAGMLFVLGGPEQAQFWMENTPLPLSIAYLDKAGRILEIYEMKPFDRSITASTSREVCYAIEANKGWFSLNGIAPGTPVKPAGLAFGKPPLSP